MPLDTRRHHVHLVDILILLQVYVHCHQGVSRSSSMVIAYLIWREGLTFKSAFEQVTRRDERETDGERRAQ